MHLEQQEPGEVPILIWWNILGNYQAFLNQSFIKYSIICQSMPVSLYMQTILRRLMCRIIFMIIAGAALPQSGQDSSTQGMRTGICCVRQCKHKLLCYFCHLSSTPSTSAQIWPQNLSHMDFYWLLWGSSGMEGLLQTELKVPRPFKALAALFCASPSWCFMCGCRASDGNVVDGFFHLYGKG